MANKFITASLIAASLLGAGSAAFAVSPASANQSVGYVVDVDLADKTVTLNDGSTYQLPQGFNIGLLSDGQKVVVAWDQVGGTALATGVMFSN